MSSTAWLSNSQWETSILNKQPIRSASARPSYKQHNTIGQYTNNYRPIRDVRGQLITAGFKVQNQSIAECIKGRNQLNTECINGQNQQNTERMNGRNQQTTECINNSQNQQITESINVRNQQTTECINDRIQQITECQNQETTEYINDRNQQTTECMKGRNQKTIECINRRNQLITKNFKVRNQPITECLEAQQIPESVRVENQPIPACIKNPNQLVTKCLKSQPITDCVLKIAVTVCLVLAVTVPPTLAEIRVGGAVNVFSRFGYLSISMRVVPRNDSDHTWIFREPIVDVFKQVVIRQSLTKSGSPSGSHPVFQGDFHMEFCDNIRQLLQAYFRDFTIEKMEHPWQAFTSSWSPAIIARNLGIDASHVTGDNGDRFCFVLVRVARHRESAAVASDAEESPRGPLQDAVAQQMARVKVGDAASVGEFVRSFGSHYVASYTTGNSLYQVFVYTPIIYKRIKDRLKSRGITSLSTGELNSYFSPWYAEHTGKVLSASGNSTMEKWALQNLRVSFYFFNYPSLLKIHGDTVLLKQLNTLLQNEALLQLELKTLAPAFDDEDKRNWFEEVVENNMILWDVNM